jgi:lipoprotein-releasing system ATP-binding protein
MTTLLSAESLSKSYQEEGGVTQNVLSKLDFKLASGDCVALLGASGSGKSTLLHCLGQLDHWDSGEVFFEGQATSQLKSKERAQLRLKSLGFVFQFHHLIPELNVLENVLLPASLLGDEPVDRAEALLKRLGVLEKKQRFPWQLSGGESQRVALARALINRPRVLLTDEATGNLDAARSQDLVSLLIELNQSEGLTLLSVTHDEQLAKRYRKQYRLKDGQIWALNGV